MIKKLPEAELMVMSIIWESSAEPIATVDILHKVNARYTRAWTTSTLQSLLNRLVSRGFLDARRTGKYKYYWPLVAREAYCAEETSEFVALHYGGSVFDLVNTLYQSQKLSREELGKLRELLEEGEDD